MNSERYHGEVEQTTQEVKRLQAEVTTLLAEAEQLKENVSRLQAELKEK
jgi:peptidoglycan hydrolase CwlO-like protein